MHLGRAGHVVFALFNPTHRPAPLRQPGASPCLEAGNYDGAEPRHVLIEGRKVAVLKGGINDI